MKIALLHGAIKNAGDFLILERSKKLLYYFMPDCEINEYYRNVSLENQVDALNNNDIIVFAGGPGYFKNFYPDAIKFVSKLDTIRKPIMALGMGWFGASAESDFLYNYEFDEKMVTFLKRIQNDTKVLGCRDFYSCNVLRNNGIGNVLMTGCPAWYDLENIEKVDYTGNGLKNISKCCISDCADAENSSKCIELIKYMRCFLGEKSKIQYVNHRDSIAPEVEKVLIENNVEIFNISGNVEGFKIYDDCDLHIGFRVHAHIYNLSKRNLSVLIEEDARGAGVNDALGLSHIKAHKLIIANNEYVKIPNNNMILEIEDYLLNAHSSNYFQYSSAYRLMKMYFTNMKNHILSIKKYV